MTVVYRLIDGGIHSDLVGDDYQLGDNETFEKPVDGIYQPFSFFNGRIVGVSQSDWEKSNPENENSSQSSDEKMADLLDRVEKLEKAAGITHAI